MPTNRRFVRRHLRRELTGDEEMELWLGPGRGGSLFASREDLEQAWLANRDKVEAAHAHPGRRVAGWWEFEGAALGLTRNYDCERSMLWRAGILSADERAELEGEWRKEFARAHQPGFVTHGRGGMLKGEEAIAAHLAWADVPAELVKTWEGEKLFTCRKCEAHYNVAHLEQPVTECPVCGWQNIRTPSPATDSTPVESTPAA
jgi:hypothetical protein